MYDLECSDFILLHCLISWLEFNQSEIGNRIFYCFIYLSLKQMLFFSSFVILVEMFGI